MPAVILKRASIVGIAMPATFLVIAGWIVSSTIAHDVLQALRDAVALAPISTSDVLSSAGTITVALVLFLAGHVSGRSGFAFSALTSQASASSRRH